MQVVITACRQQAQPSCPHPAHISLANRARDLALDHGSAPLLDARCQNLAVEEPRVIGIQATFTLSLASAAPSPSASFAVFAAAEWCPAVPYSGTGNAPAASSVSTHDQP